MLVIGGLLLGFESHDRSGLPKALRRTLNSAMIKATNLALQEVKDIGDPSRASISMALGYVFDVLDTTAKSQIQHDLLLPLLVGTMLFSKLGLQWGYFLGMMDVDVLQDANRKFGWSPSSPSYSQMQHMASGPVFASFGGLSRLVAFCISNVKDEHLVYKTSEDLVAFTRSISTQWHQNKLSEVDVTEEQVYLNEDSMRKSLPLLWQILKSTLFAVVIMETALLGRVIRDGVKPPLQGKICLIQLNDALLTIISSVCGYASTPHVTLPFLCSIPPWPNCPLAVQLCIHEFCRYTLELS